MANYEKEHWSIQTKTVLQSRAWAHERIYDAITYDWLILVKNSITFYIRIRRKHSIYTIIKCIANT